jgi:hypothetical protein
MLTKYPQYKDIVQVKPSLSQLQQQASISEKEAQKPLINRFAKELPKEALKQTIGQIPKFIASTIETPKALLTGKTSQKEYKVPGLPPFRSFQSEAETRAGEIVEGRKPLYSAIEPFATVPLAGMETAGLIGGIQKGLPTIKDLLQKRTENKQFDKALKAITPSIGQLPKREKEVLLQAGRITPKGIFKSERVIPNKKDFELANKYSDLLQDKNTIKNTNTIMKEIANEDSKVALHLASKNAIFNTGELKNKISEKLQNITDIYIPNQAILNKHKQDLTNSLINEIDKNNLFSLWKSRKNWDKLINNKINAFGGSSTLKKDLAKGVRNAVQEFITEKLRDDVYKSSMKKMTDLYNIVEVLNGKSIKEMGKSSIEIWAKNNPIIAKAIGYGLGFLGLKEAYERIK